MSKQKMDYRCDVCDGEIMTNAWVVWNPSKEEYALVEVFQDEKWCCSCDTEPDIKEK